MEDVFFMEVNELYELIFIKFQILDLVSDWF